MGKKKFTAAALMQAGEEAHLQSGKKNLHDLAQKVGGGWYAEIPVDAIQNNPMQPRISIDDERLRELAESIRIEGLIQPISVYKFTDGSIVLRAGQRRWKAHKLLGLEKIKAVVIECTEEEGIELKRMFFETAMAENTHRENLEPIEFALAVRNAIDAGIYKNPEEAAAGIKKSKSYVSKLLSVLKLDAKVRKKVVKDKVTDLEALYALQRIKDPKEQLNAYRDFVAGKMTRDEIKALVTESKKATAKPYSRSGKSFSIDLSKVDTSKRDRVKVLLDQIEALLSNA